MPQFSSPAFEAAELYWLHEELGFQPSESEPEP